MGCSPIVLSMIVVADQPHVVGVVEEHLGYDLWVNT
jgi:hypothetical protein